MRTLNQQDTILQSTADGVETDYNFTFTYGDYEPTDQDLLVYVTAPGDPVIPSYDLQQLNVAYTVTYNPEYNGGYVTFQPGYIPINGAIVTLVLNVTAEVDVQFSNAQTFNGNNLDSVIYQLFLLYSQLYVYLNQRNLSYPINSYLPGQASQNTEIPVLGNNQFWMGTGDAVIAVDYEEEPSASVLRSQLENNSSGTDGSRLVGYFNSSTGPTTVHDILNYVLENLNPLIIAQWRTADLKPTYRTDDQEGFVYMNDGTIGNAASGGTTRANADTENLFIWLWENTSNNYCPVSGGKGANAAADFAANKTIRIPLVLGRALAIYGKASLAQTFTTNHAGSNTNITVANSAIYYRGTPVQLTTTGTLPTGLSLATTYYVIIINATTIHLASSTLGAVEGAAVTFSDDGSGVQTVDVNFTDWDLAQYTGEERHLISIGELPTHDHDIAGANSDKALTDPGGEAFFKSGLSQTGLRGDSQEHNNMQPTAFINVQIKL